MPNDLRVRVASLVSTVAPSGITDAQMQNNITDYCEAMAIPLNGTNQQNLDRFTQSLWDNVHSVAKKHRKHKKLLAQSQTLDSEVDSELGTT
jgi:hypothetical protein